MVMVYQDNTLFVELSGDVDVTSFKRKLLSIVAQYNIESVVVNTREVFNYKRKAFKEVGDAVTEAYNSKFSIQR